MTETHMIIAKSPLYSSKLESVELFAWENYNMKSEWSNQTILLTSRLPEGESKSFILFDNNELVDGITFAGISCSVCSVCLYMFSIHTPVFEYVVIYSLNTPFTLLQNWDQR